MEYAAVIILVGALLATVGFVVVPERVKSGTMSAICQLFGGEGCGDVKGVAAQPKVNPSGVTSGPPATVDPNTPADPNAPVDPATEGLDPNDPDVQRYNNAKNENTNADKAVTDSQGGADEVLKQIQDFLLDVVGWKDLQKCVTSGDIVACISTLINVVPWGKVFKLLKKIPGAIKLAKRLKEIWETLSGAKKRKEAAEKALKEADDILKTKPKPKKPIVCKRPSSFVPGTLVLLADGSHRPIEDIRVGDQVWATDPLTGISGPRTVTALISSQGLKELIDLTVGNSWLGAHTITATGPHPFWNLDRGTWTQAGELNANDRLTQPDGRPVSLASVHHRSQPQRVHNLTVTGLHTYYVIAGTTPVLVHNADGCFGDKWSSADNLDNHFAKHGEDMGFDTMTEYKYAAEDLMCTCAGRRPGVLIKRDGTTQRYFDPATGEFGAAGPDGIITYFKPDDGLDYFNRQPGTLIP